MANQANQFNSYDFVKKGTSPYKWYWMITLAIMAASLGFYALNPFSQQSAIRISGTKVNLHPDFGNIRQLNSLGGQVVVGTNKSEVLDGALGSDVFLFGPGSGHDTIVAGEDAVVTKDAVEIGFASTNAIYSTTDRTNDDGETVVDLKIEFFSGTSVDSHKLGDSLIIQDQFRYRTIKKFIFKDGYEISPKDLGVLVGS